MTCKACNHEMNYDGELYYSCACGMQCHDTNTPTWQCYLVTGWKLKSKRYTEQSPIEPTEDPTIGIF